MTKGDLICKKCGRKFKTVQALGGHTSNTHHEKPIKGGVMAMVQATQTAKTVALGEIPAGDGRKPAESIQTQPQDGKQPDQGKPASPQVNPQPSDEKALPKDGQQPGGEPVPPKDSQQPSVSNQAKPQNGQQPAAGEQTQPQSAQQTASEEPSLAQQIRDYLAKGYSMKQLTEQFNYNPKTVRQEIEKLVPPENQTPTTALAAKSEILPAKMDDLRKGEVLPEYLMKHFMVLDDDRSLTPLEVLMLFQAARRTVIEDVSILQGMTEAQTRTVDTQLKILKEAREEGKGIAERAAEGAAVKTIEQIMPWLEGRLKEVETAAKQRVEKKEHAYPQLMRMMDGMMTHAFSPFMGAFGMSPQGEGGVGQRDIPGFSYKKVKEG